MTYSLPLNYGIFQISIPSPGSAARTKFEIHTLPGATAKLPSFGRVCACAKTTSFLYQYFLRGTRLSGCSIRLCTLFSTPHCSCEPQRKPEILPQDCFGEKDVIFSQFSSQKVHSVQRPPCPAVRPFCCVCLVRGDTLSGCVVVFPRVSEGV